MQKDPDGARRIRIWISSIIAITMIGCASLFPEGSPPTGAPLDVKRVSFVIVARNFRCEPSVMAVDREGRSALVKVTVRSEGARHVFTIPDFEIRRYLEPGQETTVEFLAERSGIFGFGCTRWPVMTPLDHKGKLAIR
ncbi:MAG: cupredoxin domain-containing protein [Candidatus Methylomirabilales bacterium]